jgi:hypothetical protein
MSRYRYLLPLLCGLVFFSGLIAQPASLTKVNTPPTIDGTIDQIWYASDRNVFKSLQNGSITGPEDSSAYWYGLWDDDYFYFLVVIRDDVLDDSSSGYIWENDVMEVYFNMDNSRNGGNGRTGDNYQNTFRWNHTDEQHGANGRWSGVEWAQTNTSDGYLNEVRVPWSTLTNLTIQVGYTFAFDIAINDGDGTGDLESILYWHNTAGSLYGNENGAGEATLAAAFDGNYPPTLDSDPINEAFEGTTSSFSVTASDVNSSDTLTMSSSGLPSFASPADSGTGSLNVSVDALSGDAGVYPFSVTVSDGAHNVSGEYYLIVRDPAVEFQAPVFDPVSTVIAEEGVNQTVGVSASDLDSIYITLSATTLPDFVTFTDNGDGTGTLEIVPAFGTAGSHSVVLEAVDEAAHKGTLSFSIIVNEGGTQTEFYCDPVNGNINNDGSLESPWPSLSAIFAADKAVPPGSTIYLFDGYHGAPMIKGYNASTVYIVPYEDAVPTCSLLRFTDESSNWDMSGVTISPELGGTSTGIIVGIDGEYNILRDAEVYTVADTSAWDADMWVSSARDGVSVGGDYCELLDTTILNTRWSIFMGGDYAAVRRCTIQNFSKDGIRPTGNYQIVEDCYIADSYDVDSNHDDGIQSYTDPNNPLVGCIIRRNTIIQSTDPNRPLNGGCQGIGLFDGFFDDWIIENNVVIVSDWEGIAIYGARGCKIVNNTSIDLNRTGLGRAWIRISPHKNGTPSTDNLVRNNLTSDVYWRTQSSATIDHNIEVDDSADLGAYFVNFPTDLRLVEGSSAIDAGTNVEAPDEDITGETRLSGSNTTVDIGAYEYTTTSWRGWPAADMVANTGSMLGYLNYTYEPWVFCFAINNWIYLSSSIDSNTSGWAWVMSSPE